MERMTRRNFIEGAAGVAMLGIGLDLGVKTRQAQAAFEEAAPNIDPAIESDLDLYRMHTSLQTINEVRRATIDACQDYVCEDGTTIPAIWVKAHAVLNSLGRGCGKKITDQSFDLLRWLCNNDENVADVYVNAPIGSRFTALDAAVATGRTEDECKDLLQQLAFNGALIHINVCGVDFYQHQRTAHGLCESSMNLYMEPGYIEAYQAANSGADNLPFPIYYPVPVNAEVVADERIYAYDDVDALVERHDIICVSPCQCRYLRNLTGQDRSELPHILDRDAVRDFICSDGHHLEKCITFGEEAQFYIEQGIGRQIDRDEARAILKRQVDEGCILNSCYTKYSEVICCCDGGCGVLNGYQVMVNAYRSNGAEAPLYPNISHYNLMYDKDICLKCGACAERCPMQAIEIDGEGFPTVTGVCMRCGQCGVVCPVGARKLTLKDASLIPDMPDDLLDWANKDCMYRYETGLWPTSQQG